MSQPYSLTDLIRAALGEEDKVVLGKAQMSNGSVITFALQIVSVDTEASPSIFKGPIGEA